MLDKRFEDEGGAGVQHFQKGTRLYSGGIRVGGVRGESHSVTSWDTSEGEAPRLRAVKSSEFGEGKL